MVILKPTLPFIADDQLPKDAAEAQRLAGQAMGLNEKIGRATSDVGGANAKDRANLGALYQLVDRMRVTAKDAQNYTDRSMSMSHTFFPMIEKAYPCGGADVARNMAHGLHVWIGRTKDVIGNPPAKGGLSHNSAEADADAVTMAKGGDTKRKGRGAADLLKVMERELGAVAGSHPGQLVQMADVQEASSSPLLTVGLTPPIDRSAQGIAEEAALELHRNWQRQRRCTVLARFL